MEKAIWKQAANPYFWEEYAQWYQQWLDHCSYHKGIIDFAEGIVRPGWRVLDIGAGSGVLSLPLSRKGCRVTALEPAENMRRYLHKHLSIVRGKKVHVDTRPWETVPAEAYEHYDLMVACNSLHVTPMGFGAALRKVFNHRPKHILLMTEFVSQDIKVPLIKADYTIERVYVNKVKSSFAYHSVAEAIFHWSIQKGRPPDREEVKEIRSNLVSGKNHLWMKDETWLGMYYWRKKEVPFC